MPHDPLQRRARQVLVFVTVLWAVSFPTMRAVSLAQEGLLPGRSTFFFAGLCTVYRFGLAAMVLAVWTAPTLRTMTRLEWQHGLGLGFFAGIGLLLQMDGLAHTDASTSAFLSQCYCFLIPLWVAWRDRRMPVWNVILGCALVTAGVAVLARVDFRSFRLGRGELETLIASLFFTAQILWLERARFAACRINHSTTVQFAVMALVGLPVALVTTQRGDDWLAAYRTAPLLGMLVILVAVCTLGAGVLMNHWQRHVGATLAGLIYSCEPVFASALARVAPAWLGAWAGIPYPNETLTAHLLAGGGLIFAANVIAHWKPVGGAEVSRR
ncbi:MAG: DMT family transporter [Verrucomicrobia bacterium]|nr:DMT family transporter [Verrucomicrobiota bacterium]